MVIVKLLNSSVVLAEEDGKEYILFGKGLGYNHKKGDVILPNEIERVFIPENADRYASLLETVDNRIIDLANQISNQARLKLNCELSAYLPIALIDHIQFAMERAQKGIQLQNKLLFEVQRIYPEEFAIGCEARDWINQVLNQNFGMDEAGNIAFHIVNAKNMQEDQSQSVQIIQIIKDVLNICRYHFNTEISIESMDYSRLIIHLEFFAKRILKKEMLSNSGLPIFHQVKEQCPDEYRCALKINRYVQQHYNQTLSDEELTYLAIHLHRVLH